MPTLLPHVQSLFVVRFIRRNVPESGKRKMQTRSDEDSWMLRTLLYVHFHTSMFSVRKGWYSSA